MTKINSIKILKTKNSCTRNFFIYDKHQLCVGYITIYQAHLPNCKCILYLRTASVKSWRSRWLGHTKWRHVTALDFKSRWNWCGKLRLKRRLTWRQENKQIWIQAVINIKWGRRKNYKSHFLCNVNFLWLQKISESLFFHTALLSLSLLLPSCDNWKIKRTCHSCLQLWCCMQRRVYFPLCVASQSVRQTDRSA